MKSTVHFLNSVCVPAFSESFLDFSKPIVDGDDLSKSAHQLRNDFFEYFIYNSQILTSVRKFGGEVCLHLACHFVSKLVSVHNYILNSKDLKVI